MTRANDYLEMVEGFKLGSLGANVRKFVSPATFKDTTTEKNKQKSTFRHFDLNDYRMKWTQDVSIKFLEEVLGLTPQISGTPSISIILEGAVDGMTNQFLPHVILYNNSPGCKIPRAFFFQQSFKFKTQDEFLAWLDGIKDKCKQTGLAALDFPNGWSRGH
jgi:hypothetical protein